MTLVVKLIVIKNSNILENLAYNNKEKIFFNVTSQL